MCTFHVTEAVLINNRVKRQLLLVLATHKDYSLLTKKNDRRSEVDKRATMKRQPVESIVDPNKVVLAASYKSSLSQSESNKQKYIRKCNVISIYIAQNKQKFHIHRKCSQHLE